MIAELRTLSRGQRAVCIASFLGWSLDAFDFFLMVFVVKTIAGDFHVAIKSVAFAITLTLMFRPLGALFFGWLAERFGRRPVLMVNVLLFSFLELASAFAPSLAGLFILRALFGFAMGGEWGVGSSLAMETIPVESRGVISGILQEGYAFGYLLAAIVYGLFFAFIGWRGMFAIGVLPALLVFYIRLGVKESPVWEKDGRRAGAVFPKGAFQKHGKRFLYVILLMTCFNFLSHGTQDLYPTFLEAQHRLAPHVVSAISIVANWGAILGGVAFGICSQRFGRRRAIVTAAVLVLPVIPLWAFSSTPFFLGVGAFLIQLVVQGAWGVVPVHLNELSPEGLRGVFPGFAYQLGNFFACGNAVWQAGLASEHHGDYGFALALVAGLTAVVLALITASGPEDKGVVFGRISEG
jgi:SHS family lactate transporter-like MFS transporter